MDDEALARARSLALHAKIAERVERDPTLIDGARERITRWRTKSKHQEELARAWLAVLDAGLGEVLSVLRDPGERASELRAVTPFGFVVSARERSIVWKTVARARPR